MLITSLADKIVSFIIKLNKLSFNIFSSNTRSAFYLLSLTDFFRRKRTFSNNMLFSRTNNISTNFFTTFLGRDLEFFSIN